MNGCRGDCDCENGGLDVEADDRIVGDLRAALFYCSRCASMISVISE